MDTEIGINIPASHVNRLDLRALIERVQFGAVIVRCLWWLRGGSRNDFVTVSDDANLKKTIKIKSLRGAARGTRTPDPVITNDLFGLAPLAGMLRRLRIVGRI